ncbi:NAD-dependent epimerase/dehydratase family protein [Pararhizobium sp. DWP3-4]|uniref:NAD-dependent epimerase/dehydratase family protein n=1 Tax=Pararhizobium sp. DWP3-4 TaxID=2804565 RepID=UPI003CFAC370
MKTAAIIGARSMLGSQLIERLQQRGVVTITVGRSMDDDVYFDLRSERAVIQNDLRADVVFHCAATFFGDDEDGVRQNFSTNAASALPIAGLVQELDAKSLVYAGSIFSDETLGSGNFTSYGLTKAIAEQVMSWALEKQDKLFCSLRFAQLYDTAGRCCAHQPWFGRVIAYASHGKDMRMPRSDGVRNFLHVRDAADMMIQAATCGTTGILNVVHPESLPFEEIANIAYEVFGEGGKVVIAPEKPPFRPIHFPHGAETFERLAFEPAVGMRQGIHMIRDSGTAKAFGPMDIT